MAHITADRVRESSTTTGAGDFTLAGAVTGSRTFANAMASGDTCEYVISMGSQWEVGIGTLSGTTTLQRTTIVASSNSGSAVSFTSGTKDVALTASSARLGGLPQSGLLTQSGANLLFAPKNGNRIMIGGILRNIPNAGITAGVTGVMVNAVAGQTLGTSTNYLVSTYNNSGTPALAYWTVGTGRTTDTATGAEIISGQPGHSVVGLMRTTSLGAIASTGKQLFVRSWFNRQTISGKGSFTTSRNTTGTASFYEIHTEIRTEWVAFAGEVARIGHHGTILGHGSNATTTSTVLAIDGSTSTMTAQTNSLPAANYGTFGGNETVINSSDTNHYATLFTFDFSAGVAVTYASAGIVVGVN